MYALARVFVFGTDGFVFQKKSAMASFYEVASHNSVKDVSILSVKGDELGSSFHHC